MIHFYSCFSSHRISFALSFIASSSLRGSAVTDSSCLFWDFQLWQNFVKCRASIFFSRLCFQMLNYPPISCFYLHYFKVSVNKDDLFFDPGVQRDAVSSVCTIGWGRNGTWTMLSILPRGLENPLPTHTALWQLSQRGSLHRPHCQVSFQVPSLLHKGFYKETTYFMRQDQREPGEGEGLSRTLFLFCRIGSCCCECLSQWSMEFAISLGLDH